MKKTVLFLMLFVSIKTLFAQIIEGTPCTATCIDPTKSSISGRQPNQNGSSPNLNLPCGGGTSEDNPAWWIIRPKGNSLTFQISTSNCVAGQCGIGVQMTLWEGDACGSVTAVNCVVGTSGVMTTQVTPCKIYYLQIDGLCESQCNIVLTYDKNQILTKVDKPLITGNLQACKGEGGQVCATIPTMPGCTATSWKWTMEPASAGPMVSSPNSNCAIYKIWGPIPANGKIKVCAEPVFKGKCPPTTQKECKEITVLDLKPATCDVSLCPENQPFVYDFKSCVLAANPNLDTSLIKPKSFTINLPAGTNKTENINYKTAVGCHGNIALNIKIANPIVVQFMPVLICEGDQVTVKGQVFSCADASKTPKRIVKSTNGVCDTIFEVLVQCLKIKPTIVGTGTLDCTTKSLTLDAGSIETTTFPADVVSALYTATGSREYAWSRDGILLSGENKATLIVTKSGVYEVTVSYTYSVMQNVNGLLTKVNKTCSKTTSVLIIESTSSTVAETPIANTIPCVNGTATYKITPAPLATYVWNVTGDATIQGNNTAETVNVMAQQSPYDVCVTKTACGKSDKKCITISPNTSTTPTIIGQTNVCQGDSVAYRIPERDTKVSIKWSVQNGAIIHYNVDSSEVYVKWNKNVLNGKISVTAFDFCGSKSGELIVTFIELPKTPNKINGKKILCVNEVQTYSVEDIHVAAGYKWTLEYGGTLLQDTGKTITVKWNQEGLFSLCVKSVNNCFPNESDTLCMSIYVKPIPIPQAGTRKQSCDLSILLNPVLGDDSNMGTWSQVSGQGLATFDILNPNAVKVSECGLYKFALKETDGVCSGYDTISIIFSTPPSVNFKYNCSKDKKTYDATFELMGCNEPFKVSICPYPYKIENNATITVSGIPINDIDWVIIFANNNNCNITYSVHADCNCITRAGEMDIKKEIYACINSPVQAFHKAGTEVNDGNDTFIFMLHEGKSDTIYNPIRLSKTGIFNFEQGMTCNKTYYVSYLMGNEKNGVPDFADKCLSSSPKGQPVQWHCITNTTANCNSPLCSGSTLQLNVSNGLSYKWEGPDGFSSTLQNPTLTNIAAKNAGNYNVTVTNLDSCSVIASTFLEVKNCIATNDLSEAANIQIFPNPAFDKLTILAKENIRKIVFCNNINQEILIKLVDNKEATLDISALPQGLYFAKVYLTANEFAIFKVILKN